jgi:hypothetical protein
MKTGNMRRRRSWLGLAAVVMAIAGLVGLSPSAGAQGGTATITAVHGVRGLVADVYLDGQLVLPGFQPERTTDPMTVPAGSHRLDVRKAGDPATAVPLVSSTFDTPAGRRASLLVHLGATGAPQVSIYDDDVAPIPAGQVRLVLRHGAAAGPVDFLLDGLPVVRALANTAQFASNQGAAAHELAITATGQAAPASGPHQVDLQSGSSYTFYLIGSAGTSSLSYIVSRIDGLGPLPLTMQTGSGGSARSLADPASDRATSAAPWLLAALGLAGMVGGRLLVVRRRRAALAVPGAPIG